MTGADVAAGGGRPHVVLGVDHRGGATATATSRPPAVVAMGQRRRRGPTSGLGRPQLSAARFATRRRL